MFRVCVVFPDEPTTGLGSTASLMLARLLRSLSRRLLVIVTVHQPSNAVLAQFDVLLLVKAPGELAFYGPFRGAAEFFRGLPHRFPAQLGDVRVPTPHPGDNLADIVLGALKVVAKRETNCNGGSNGREETNDKQAASSSPPSSDEPPFNCRDAFLHSSYARPLMRALVSIHGEEAAAKQFALRHSQQQQRNQSSSSAASSAAAENKEGEYEFTIPLPPNLSSTANAAAVAVASPLSSSSSNASSAWRPLYLCFRELMRRFFLSTIRAQRSFFLRFFTCLFYGFVTVSAAAPAFTLTNESEHRNKSDVEWKQRSLTYLLC